MTQRVEQPVAARQPQRPMLDQVWQCPTLRTGLPVGLGVIERAGMFFPQAHGFGQPEAVEGIR